MFVLGDTILIMAYEPHPHCDTPNDDAVVWRYMGTLQFMSLLENKSL